MKLLILLLMAAFLVHIVGAVTINQGVEVVYGVPLNVTYNFTVGTVMDSFQVNADNVKFNNETIKLNITSGSLYLDVLHWNNTNNTFTLKGSGQEVNATITRNGVPATEIVYNGTNSTNFTASSTPTTFYYVFNITTTTSEDEETGGGGGGGRIGVERLYEEFFLDEFFNDTVELEVVLTGPEFVVGGQPYEVNALVKLNGVFSDPTEDPVITIRNPYYALVDKRAMRKPVYTPGLRDGYYTYLLESRDIGLDGVWHTEIEFVYNGQTKVVREDWEVRSAPTKITIRPYDTQPSDVSCEITVVNEGQFPQEYNVRWWLGDDASDSYGDSLSNGAEAKRLNPGEEWKTLARFLINRNGEYWCNTDADYGARISAASAQFSITEFEEIGPLRDVWQALRALRGDVYVGIFLFIIVVLILFAVSNRRKKQ